MTKREVSFLASDEDRTMIRKVVARARKLLAKDLPRRRIRPSLDMRMDLLATHANGCPMDFKKLLGADEFNLMHDIIGIERHLDRETGCLTGHFRPRCAARSS